MFLSLNIPISLLKFFLITLLYLLVACSQSTATEVTDFTLTEIQPVSTNTPLALAATKTSPPPTGMPPTETAMSPTELPASPVPILPTNTPTIEPTIALQEVITSQTEDIVGDWKSQRGSQLIFTQSGGARILDRTGTEMVGIGTFHFEDEQLILDSDVCLKFEAGMAIEFACVAAYTVYVTKEIDEVVSLRFDIIEDPYRDRKNVIAGHNWQRSGE